MDMTVGLDTNGVPKSNVIERDVRAPSWTMSPTNRAGALVKEEVREKVAGPLQQVRNVVLDGDLVYRQSCAIGPNVQVEGGCGGGERPGEAGGSACDRILIETANRSVF